MRRMCKNPCARVLTQGSLCCSPLAHDLSVHLELFVFVALYDQHDVLTNHEVSVLMLIGVVTHTDHAIRQITEHAATILARNHSKAPGANGMTLLCPKEGIDLRFFDGDLQLIVIRVEHLHNTVDLHARVVFIPQVRNRGVAHLPLGNIQIMSI